jgi:hypothetical protein
MRVSLRVTITTSSRLLAVTVPLALVFGAARCEPDQVPAEPVPERDTALDPALAAIVPGPDGTVQAGRCTQYEDLLVRYAPARGWDVERMSRLASRESGCWPDVRSRTSDTGLLQINDISLDFLTTALGEPVDRWTLTEPVQNIRAAAALCDFWASNGRSCYQPWGR